jgi:esterase/lipase superfamily enzyme
LTEQYHRWHSPNLNLDLEMLVFGDRGFPVILFPTTKGRYHQNKDFGLIDSVRWFVDEGLVKIYCPDTIDDRSWYDKSIHPADRARNYAWYDKMLTDELMPWAQHETGVGKVAVAGCSFGGYHAANFAFKHPERWPTCLPWAAPLILKCLPMGFIDDDIFYNNPVDFLPGSNKPELWQMNIILGTSEHDMCKDYNIRMSNILNEKHINHWLDIRPFANHDWPIWKEMFPHYLSTIK